jgi:hypothetical protein
VTRISEQRNATALNLSSAMKTAVIVILCVALAPVLLIGAFVALDWAPERTVAEGGSEVLG